MRIVSLLPSATEMVCTLGLEDQLVGVTHECDFPPLVAGLPKVTRTLIPADASSAEIDHLVRERLRTSRALYTLDLPTLKELRPDLIVTQALCDVCAVAEEEVRAAACALPGRPGVINLEPQTLGQVFDAIREIAKTAGVDRVAEDGSQYFSRPGPRLVDSLEILAYALHPDAHPLPAGLPSPVRVIGTGVVDRGESHAAHH